MSTYNWKRTRQPNDSDSPRESALKAQHIAARLGQPDSFQEGSVQTAATGSNYTALPSKVGSKIVADNLTGQSLTVRRVGGASTLVFASGARIELPVAANANEWEIKRTDNSNTQVTLAFFVFGIA